MDTNQLNNSRGSEWRKWDLHIHTPLSINQNYGGVSSFDKFISALENLPEDVKVIGITDYYFIDGFEKVMEYRNKGRLQNIEKIFPILEFRIDTFGSGNENNLQKINLHIVFNVNEGNLKNEISQINNEFIKQIPLTKLDRHKTKCLSIENLSQEGGNLQDGFSSLIPPTDKVFDLLNSSTWKNRCFLLLGYKEWSNLEKNQQLKPLKDDLYSKVGAFFGNNFSNNENNQKWLNEYGNKKLLHSLDIHSFVDLDTFEFDEKNERKSIEKYHCNTWVKADPTFEGLKQIIYEPDERVKIQEKNPNFDFEKSPFTEIQINENVEVFENEPDNVIFEKCTLPLNNGLVSIIGGRGTGKSILIDYISAGLGQNIKKKSYTKSTQIVIKRQTSLKDKETSFVISDNPNVQFMYISQSEIKSIVENALEFTKNIRETIGVIDNYIVPREYKEKADRNINDFFSVIKILDAENTNSSQKKENLEKEIKRYNDFITNITSQENQEKLKQYQSHIKNLEWKKSFQENVIKQREIILQFEKNTNEELQKINEPIAKLNLAIPLLNNSNTTDYILNEVIPAIKVSISKTEEEIQKTKDAFAGYTGDLTTLLGDVAKYQSKVNELQNQKKNIEENEIIFETIKQNYFKELGFEIETSINAYKTEIENKWFNFKNGSEDYSEEQKQLLCDILGSDNLNVEVQINFNKDRMYQLLMQKLDGRSWNDEKLEHTLKITDLDSYFNFIKQLSSINTFSSEINPIRSYVLDVLFRKYNEYIIHNILVTSKGKNITKLSHGQQGTIYLRLKLAANLFSKTIIYDQPEDDLDNEFIMSDLVSIFRKIKKYRQIIIVSHNANLVVNADSEQVIIAKNEDGILKYCSGALENPEINKQICRILEGGETAFLNREKKYDFKTQKI